MPEPPTRTARSPRWLGVLVAAGVLAYCGMLVWQEGGEPAEESVRVLRYARDVPAGDRLSPQDVVEDAFLLAERPGQWADAVSPARQKGLSAFVTAREVKQGQVVQDGDLVRVAAPEAAPAPAAPKAPLPEPPPEAPASPPAPPETVAPASDDSAKAIFRRAWDLYRRGGAYDKALAELRRLRQAPHHTTDASFKAYVLIPLCQARLALAAGRLDQARKHWDAANHRLSQLRSMRNGLKAWADEFAPELTRVAAEMPPP